MAGLTLEGSEAALAEWMAANTAVAAKQSYSIDGRSLTFADASQIRMQIDYWDKKCKELARDNAGPRVRFGVPV